MSLTVPRVVSIRARVGIAIGRLVSVKRLWPRGLTVTRPSVALTMTVRPSFGVGAPVSRRVSAPAGAANARRTAAIAMSTRRLTRPNLTVLLAGRTPVTQASFEHLTAYDDRDEGRDQHP